MICHWVLWARQVDLLCWSDYAKDERYLLEHGLLRHPPLECHTADIITRRRLSPADWKDMVDVMVNHGAKAGDKQKAEIVEYLSRALSPLAATPDKDAPAPPAR
jgi:hypothetical protein